MKLTIENIGKVKKAEVEINGITVIAGENDTGKSTVSRALFAVFNGFHNINDQLNKERLQSVHNLIEREYHKNLDIHYRTGWLSIGDLAKSILDDRDVFAQNRDELREHIVCWAKAMSETLTLQQMEAFADGLVPEIQEVLKVTDEEIMKSAFGKRLRQEFNNQICNLYSKEEGRLQLQIRESMTQIKVLGNMVTDIRGAMDLHTETVYLDDPFILEQRSWRFYVEVPEEYDHRAHLKKRILGGQRELNTVEEILVNKKMESIIRQIYKVCSGNIVSDSKVGLGYQASDEDVVFNLNNLSTGLKTFVILKMLLLNGTLEENGTIILDEPEIHLHPEWQLVFAELIVLLLRDFHMHILINTHSPYFLNAIEVYSEKYGLKEKCKYYLAQKQGEFSQICDVTRNIEKIYQQLARPLQELENQRYQYDQDGKV